MAADLPDQRADRGDRGSRRTPRPAEATSDRARCQARPAGRARARCRTRAPPGPAHRWPGFRLAAVDLDLHGGLGPGAHDEVATSSARSRGPAAAGALAVASFRTGLLSNFAVMLFFASYMFTLALLLQAGLGLNAFEAGLAFAPAGVTFLTSALLAPRLVARHGPAVLVGGSSPSGSTRTNLWDGWPDPGHLTDSPGCPAA